MSRLRAFSSSSKLMVPLPSASNSVKNLSAKKDCREEDKCSHVVVGCSPPTETWCYKQSSHSQQWESPGKSWKLGGKPENRREEKKAAFCRGVLAPKTEGAAQGKEGALGTWDGTGKEAAGREYSLAIAKHVQRQAVDSQSILRCQWLIGGFHSCLLQSTASFLIPSSHTTPCNSIFKLNFFQIQ